MAQSFPINDFLEVRGTTIHQQGLYARINIPMGTRMLEEWPLLVSHGAKITEHREDELEHQLAGIPAQRTVGLLRMHNHHPSYLALCGLMRSNGFPLDPFPFRGLFIEISRISPSLDPNTWFFGSATLAGYLEANRDIAAGEELTLAYEWRSAQYQTRQAYYEASGCVCYCAECFPPRQW